MATKCVPMIHVPDVRATVQWYQGIGFSVVETYGDGGEGLSFAILSFGNSEVMFNSGGRPSTGRRREVDLYVYSENVEALHERLKDSVDVVEGPHDTFYGMREVIIRDLNGFWITFGETSAGEMLMTGVGQGDADVVRAALQRGGLTPERLSAALAAATGGDRGSAAIVGMLEKAGAVAPPFVDVETLQRYAGTYKSEEGLAVRVTLQGGTLLVVPDDAQAVRLLPLDQTAFRPLELADATVTFEVGEGKATGLAFTQGSKEMHLRRAEDGDAS